MLKVHITLIERRHYYISDMAQQDYNTFWSQRPFHIIGSYPIEEWKAIKTAQLTARNERVEKACHVGLKRTLAR